MERWLVQETSDPMDDSRCITASTLCTSPANVGKKRLEPSLHVRATRAGVSAVFEALILVGDRFFSRKGAAIAGRVRFDRLPPIEVEFSVSTDLGAAFFPKGFVTVQPMLDAERILVELAVPRAGTLLVEFDMREARGVMATLLEGAYTGAPETLLGINPTIADFLLRAGPRFTSCLQRGLSAVGHYKGTAGGPKSPDYFAAAQAFATAQRASEIYGMFEPGKPSPNMPWHYTLGQRMPEALKREMGPLTIFD